MDNEKIGNFIKLSIDAIEESVKAEPKVPCTEEESRINSDQVLIYIKINVRKNPYKKVFIISFHKNRSDSLY